MHGKSILWRLDCEASDPSGDGGGNRDGSSGVVLFALTASRVTVPDPVEAYQALRPNGVLTNVGSIVRVGAITPDPSRPGEYEAVHDQRTGAVVPAAPWAHLPSQ